MGYNSCHCTIFEFQTAFYHNWHNSAHVAFGQIHLHTTSSEFSVFFFYCVRFSTWNVSILLVLNSFRFKCIWALNKNQVHQEDTAKCFDELVQIEHWHNSIKQLLYVWKSVSLRNVQHALFIGVGTLKVLIVCVQRINAFLTYPSEVFTQHHHLYDSVNEVNLIAVDHFFFSFL